MSIRNVLLSVVAVVLIAACGTGDRMAKMQNVKPPAAGTPGGPGDVSGIYRSAHLGTLQLRSDGTIPLIVPNGGASAGRFTLQDGRIEVQTSSCGQTDGSYNVTVTGLQKAGKATLVITGVNDECATRLRDLTRDPWVYADS